MQTQFTNDYLDAIDLEELLAPKLLQRRQAEAGEEVLFEIINKEINAMRQSQSRVLEALAVYSQIQADTFFEYAEDLKRKGGGEFPYYGTRVRLRDNTLTLVWYTNAFTKEKKWYARDMRRGYGGKMPMRYNLKQFKKAEGQELESIVDIEESYELVRYALESHRKLRTALAELEGRVKKIEEN